MGIFSDDDDTVDSHGCPIEPGESTVFEHGSSYHAIYYTTAACAAITLISSVALILMHLRRYRVPKEQRQIVKIVFTPAAFALVSFGCLSNYHVAPYIQDLGEWYSAMCLTTLFLLYIQFAVPDSDFSEGMFQAMHKVAEGHSGTSDQGGWPKLGWILVFQYPVTETLALIILEGTTATGTYCATSFKPKFGHLWNMIIKTIGLVLCFVTVLRFYRRMKPILKARRGALKLFGFKGIVALRFVQNWIFQILIKQGVLKNSNNFTLGDLAYGIPNVLLAAEMVIFSAVFWYAYSSTEYSSKARPNYEQLNIFHAFFDAINPADTIMGVLRIPIVLASRGGGTTMGQYAGPTRYGPVDGQGYHHASYSLDGNDAGRPSFGYGQAPYQPPPPFHSRDDEEEDKRHLFADARGTRTPSPRPY